MVEQLRLIDNDPLRTLVNLGELVKQDKEKYIRKLANPGTDWDEVNRIRGMLKAFDILLKKIYVNHDPLSEAQ